MKIGRRIKNAFGVSNSVDAVSFIENDKHIVLLMKSDDLSINHKQVNAVLNRYALATREHHWIFVECRLGAMNYIPYISAHEVYEQPIDWWIMSVYRIDKKSAMKRLMTREDLNAVEELVKEKEAIAEAKKELDLREVALSTKK